MATILISARADRAISAVYRVAVYKICNINSAPDSKIVHTQRAGHNFHPSLLQYG